MSKNEKQIIALTLVGVVLAIVSAGVAAAVIPLVIGLLALGGEWLYQNEVEKVKTSEQSSEAFTKKQIKVLKSKQDATSAYKSNFSTVEAKCQPRYKQNVSKSEVIEC